MKSPRTFLFGLVAVVAASFCVSNVAMAENTEASPSESGLYRHVVLFKFKDDASAEQVRSIEEAFANLPSQIAEITDYEWGKNVSPEGLDDGFTHCFFVSFKDKSGLEAYLPHEAHQAFVTMLKPLLDKVCVIDYVASSGA